MKTEDLKFDFDKTLKAFMEGRPLTGENSPLKPLIKRLTEAALEAELDAHLAKINRRNGRTGKSLKTSEGLIELLTPRDRCRIPPLCCQLQNRFFPAFSRINGTEATRPMNHEVSAHCAGSSIAQSLA